MLETPYSTTCKQLYLWMFSNVNDGRGDIRDRSLSNIDNTPKPVHLACLSRTFSKPCNSDFSL